MINATYNGQTYQDVTTLVASDGTSNATVTLTESGGGGGVGDLTEYEQIRVTPDVASDLEFSNPFGTNTKFIIITCVNAPQTGISYIAITSEAGAYQGINVASGNFTTQPATKSTYAPNVGNGTYAIDDTTKIHQSSANLQFDTSTEYIINIYA